MSYTREQATALKAQCETAWIDLLKLHVRFDQVARDLGDEHTGEHLRFGVGRRFNLIGFALRNIYRIFPPDRETTLGLQELADVQLNLHAFVINVSGAFDNMAWAFVFRHGLLNEIGGRTRVGILQDATRRHLPPAVRAQLEIPETQRWLNTYLKDYRDALAHRIPLYLPPSIVTQEESVRYNAIEQEKVRELQRGDFQRIEELEGEQARLGRPCFFMLHSFNPVEPSRRVWFHPQIVSDVRALVEFGALFLDRWHERS